MKNSIFSRFAKLSLTAMLLLSLTAFTGCPNSSTTDSTSDPANSSLSVTGTWLESGSYGNSYYEVTESYFKNYGDNGDEASKYESYEGDSVTIVKESSTSGYIYIKYTKAYEAVYEEPTEDLDSWTHYASDTYEYWYRYSTSAPDVGKWYALHYKNLTASSVDISAAFGTVTSTDTLEEAKAEFTVANDYYGYYSSCAKVNE